MGRTLPNNAQQVAYLRNLAGGELEGMEEGMITVCASAIGKLRQDHSHAKRRANRLSAAGIICVFLSMASTVPTGGPITI